MDINIRKNPDVFKDARPKVQEVVVPIGIPKILNYWRAASRFALILFAALAPIFFLPFTALPVAVHKEVFVFLLILVAFFALLGRILIEGRIRYPGHLLTLALLVLVIVWGASAFFSVNQIGSLIGSWATPDSFMALLLFTVLSISIVMTFDRRDIVLSLLAFLASLSILGIFELLQLMKIFVLPIEITKSINFNPVGSINDSGVLLAFGLVIASGLISSTEISKTLKRVLGAVAVIFFINLILIDFWVIWTGLALAMIFMISFLSLGLADNRSGSTQMEADQRGNYQRESTGNPRKSASMPEGLQLAYFQKAWLPSVILLLSLIFLFIPSPFSSFVQTPVEVSPNFSATFNIATQNLSSGGISSFGGKALLGSGPNTFSYAFNLYKPVNINQTIFWQTVFISGASAVTTWLSSVGVLGVLSILFLIFAFVFTGISGTSVRNASRGFMNIASQAIFVGVTFLFIMWFLYGVNFSVLAFAFWGIGLFLASSLFFMMENRSGSTQMEADQRGNYQRESAFDQRKSAFREIKIFTSPPKTFLFSLLIVGLMVLSAVGAYFEANRYIAEIYFGRTFKAAAASNNTQVINDISKAIDFWPYDERYFSRLSQAIFGELNVLLSRKDLSQDELRANFQNITTNALAVARKAQELNPKNPAHAALLGNMYENLTPFIGDATTFAASSYSAAAALDPKNPSHQLALARVAINSKDLDKAATFLEKAISLKNDYAPARFLLVQVNDQQGKLLDAIKRAEELAAFNINDVGVLFQLGFLYYKNNDLDKSRQVFERTVKLNSNYSNARYFLGLIYDRESATAPSEALAKEGKEKSIEQFQRIAGLNPDNNEVKQILANLKTGKAALTGIAPPAPQNRAEAPVQEGAKTPVQPLKK